MDDPIRFVDLERFWSKVDRSSGPSACWPWLSSIDHNGYGKYRVKRDGRYFHFTASRLAYLLTVGPIEDGLVIDHLCRNRPCCNPGHMEPVTNGENVRRGETGVNLRRRLVDGVPMCSNGHAVIGENARPRPSNPKWLQCRQCARDGMARYKERQPI